MAGDAYAAFYALPRWERWLDNPYAPGGWDANPVQTLLAFESLVLDVYPEGEVPSEVKEQLEALRSASQQWVSLYEGLVERVSLDIAGRKDEMT